MTDIPNSRRSPLEHEHCLPAPAAPQVSVKSLVWKGTEKFKYSTNEFGQYQIREAQDGFYVQFDGSRSVVIAAKLASCEEGIQPAQEHHKSCILSAIDTTPVSVVDDPRVQRLVDALERALSEPTNEPSALWVPEARAALAALSETTP